MKNVTRDLNIKLHFCCITMQSHPFFEGVQWEKLYQMEAAFTPEVNDELDTQNFEKFEEVFDYFRLFLFCISILSSSFTLLSHLPFTLFHL